LRIPILKVDKISGVGTVAIGRVVSGELKPGDCVVLSPSRISAEVASIEQYHSNRSVAVCGDIVGFKVKGVGRSDLRRGMVACHAKNDPQPPIVSFTAKIVITNHPASIRAGYTPFMCIHTDTFPCKFESLLAKLDKKTGQEIEANPKEARNGDRILVKMVPMKPVCVEVYEKIPALARFVIRDNGTTVAVGAISAVTPHDPSKKAAPPLKLCFSLFN